MAAKVKKLDPKIVEELFKMYKKPEDLLGEGGILKVLQKALLEGVLSPNPRNFRDELIVLEVVCFNVNKLYIAIQVDYQITAVNA